MHRKWKKLKKLKIEAYFYLLRLLKRIKIPSILRSAIPISSNFLLRLNISEPSSYLIRQLFDATYHAPHFLAEPDLPEIDVLICCTDKDLRSLQEMIHSIFEYSLNPIRLITIISPDYLDIPSVKIDSTNRIRNLLDKDILDELEIDLIKSVSPLGRYGWVTQQVLKIKYASNSNSKYLLVIDSDTILLRPHAFVNKKGIQALSISYEKHGPYLEHSSLYFNLPLSAKSYVTHYQLWQISFIKEMFPDRFDSIYDWLKLSQSTEASGFSEFHCYGMWIEQKHPNKRVITSWRNLNVSHEKWIESKLVQSSFAANYGPLNSVSVHSYLL